MKEKRLFYFVSVFKGVNLAELIVLVEIVNGKCRSLQLHELILGSGLAGLVTKPFVVSNKCLNFYKGVESTVESQGS